MIKYLLLFLFGVSFFDIANAQKQSNKDTLTYYFKDNDQMTVKDSADYSLLILPKTNKGLYPIREFYKDGKLKLSAASRTHSLQFKLEGPGIAYYPNGNPLRTMTYEDGRTVGDVTEYYSNGNPLRISRYKDGIQNGAIKEFYPNGKIYSLKLHSLFSDYKYIECWDSTGVAFAQKGNGKWVEYNDDFNFSIRQIPIKNGVLTGIWQPVIDTSKYAIYDKTGPVMTNVNIMPYYKGAFISLNQFLKKSLIYPLNEEKNKISGNVSISMIVEKNGALTHLRLVSSSSKALGDEAMRLIGLSSPWVPGSLSANGPLVRAQITLALIFKTVPGPNGQVYNDVSALYLNNQPGPIISYEEVKDKEYDKTGNVLSASDVDTKPEFPGGLEAFGHFLGGNIRYPAYERANMISGKVLTQFIVEKDGHLSNIHAIRGPDQGLMDEAVMVLKLSPIWSPGLKDNKPVRVTYVVPISFTIDDAPVKKDTLSTDPIIEVEPAFPGGLQAFGNFIAKHLHYPEVDRKNGISGKVIVSFVIEKDGSVVEINAVNGPSKTLMDEGIRVIKLSPKWKPAIQNGKAVRVKYTVPITFN